MVLTEPFGLSFYKTLAQGLKQVTATATEEGVKYAHYAYQHVQTCHRAHCLLIATLRQLLNQYTLYYKIYKTFNP